MPTTLRIRKDVVLSWILIALAIFGIIARARYIFEHPTPIDVLAIVLALAISGLAIFEAFKGRVRRAKWLLVIEYTVGLFLFWRLDLPFANQSAVQIEPVAVVLQGDWTDLIARTPIEHFEAASMRITAAGSSLPTFQSQLARAVIEHGECPLFLHEFVTFAIPERALHQPYARLAGACIEATTHDKVTAADLYLIASDERPALARIDATKDEMSELLPLFNTLSQGPIPFPTAAIEHDVSLLLLPISKSPTNGILFR